MAYGIGLAGTPRDHFDLAVDPPALFPRVAVDPVTLQVVGGALEATAREMAQTLFRMAFSNLVREAEDIGAGIFDIAGRELAESATTPMHIASVPAYVRGANTRLAGQYRPGDVILHNNPYKGASHTYDYGVIVPVFHEGTHVAFAACTAHMLDVGGGTPGYAIDVPDVWAEGRIFDAVRIVAEGERNEELIAHLLDNVRSPSVHRGDLDAMISCCKLGAVRFESLLERYGAPTVFAAADEWMDYSERMLRTQIAAIPDGVYSASGQLEDDGRNRGEPVNLSVSVEVRGSDLVVDLSASSSQRDTAINVPFEGSTVCAVVFAVRTLLLDEALIDQPVPQNDGIFRPISIVAPYGSIYNPRFPKPCVARFPAANRLSGLITEAFAEALPEHATAGNTAAVQAIVYTGFDDEAQQYWTYFEVCEGAYGARNGKDGLDAVDSLLPNTRNTPVEETELRSPLRCTRYELRDGWPAPGRWRGGVGTVRQWEFLVDTWLSAQGDGRQADPPRGVHGGGDGSPGALVLIAPDGTRTSLPSRFSDLRVAAGSTLVTTLPSGGAYGAPSERPAAAVRADVADELLDTQDAERLYELSARGES